MKKIFNFSFAALLVLGLLACGYCEDKPMPGTVRTSDVNKDGKPDITYHVDGENITKIEADTNYDGKPDVIIKTKDGKFASAEADTDYNGTMDRKFTNDKDFIKWVNDTNPVFKDHLDQGLWKADLIKF